MCSLINDNEVEDDSLPPPVNCGHARTANSCLACTTQAQGSALCSGDCTWDHDGGVCVSTKCRSSIIGSGGSSECGNACSDAESVVATSSTASTLNQNVPTPVCSPVSSGPLGAYKKEAQRDCVGADVHWGWYTTEQCARECSKRSDCTFFVMNENSNYCWLKNNKRACGDSQIRYLYSKTCSELCFWPNVNSGGFHDGGTLLVNNVCQDYVSHTGFCGASHPYQAQQQANCNGCRAASRELYIADGRMSSVLVDSRGDFSVQNCFDGVTRDETNLCHTNVGGGNQWVEVDLAGAHLIEAVRIYECATNWVGNELHCGPSHPYSKMTTFRIEVTDASGVQRVCSEGTWQWGMAAHKVQCSSPIVGTAVRVIGTNGDYMSLNEIEVIGK